MIAILRGVHSPDVDDIGTFTPSSSAFSILIQMLVGPSDSLGEESFDVLVCSPDWLRQQPDPVIGRHLLIVNVFHWEKIRSFLERKVSECQGTDWSRWR